MNKNSFLYTSYDSFSTTDGPGIRSILFLAKCPLRCIYCHNPETFVQSEFKELTFEQLKKWYLNSKVYYKNKGGITFSGGEPLLWAKEILEFKKYMDDDINICLETSGNVNNEFVDKLINNINSLFCDIKFNNQEDYSRYTNGSLTKTLEFLKKVDKREELAKNTVIRQVVVPNINDSYDSLKDLGLLVLNNFKNIRSIEFLPFHNMCTEKYKKYNMEWKLGDTPCLDNVELKMYIDKLNIEFKDKLEFI